MEQTSAVFLTADGNYVVKIYLTGALEWKGPELEYWINRYLAE